MIIFLDYMIPQQEIDRGMIWVPNIDQSFFIKNETEKESAQNAINRANSSGLWKNSVVTQVVPWQTFYKAEEYHQDYLHKNPFGYTCHWIRTE